MTQYSFWDALKTGNRIRRKGWETWQNFETSLLRSEDFAASDWEVEDKPLEISQAKFDAVFEQTIQDLLQELGLDFGFPTAKFLKTIKMKLGFPTRNS